MSNNCIQRWIHTFGMVGVLSGSSLLGALTIALTGISSTAGSLPAQAQQNRLERRDPPGDPDQVPTARYARGEPVDLSLIVEEWRGRYPATPVFACTCRAATCGESEVWPFRTFTLYQPFLALGKFNAANNEASGFNCFDMQTGDRP